MNQVMNDSIYAVHADPTVLYCTVLVQSGEGPGQRLGGEARCLEIRNVK